MKKFVNCPNCNREVEWSAEKSPWRPFCSERCKLIDLGEWASESHKITGDAVEQEPFSSEFSDDREI